MFGLARRGSFDPFQDLMTLQQRINRFFEDSLLDAERAELAPIWRPAIDIYEEPDAMYVEADLPGLRKDDVTVNLEDNVLTIQGQRKRQNEEKRDNYHRIERASGMFSRSFTLPSTVDREKIDAEFKDGVLRIRLPKQETAKPKQIKVRE